VVQSILKREVKRMEYKVTVVMIVREDLEDTEE
jgi:hypothetical protein